MNREHASLHKMVSELTERALQTQHGFGYILADAQRVFAEYSRAECLEMAHDLYSSEARQARMLGTFIFGMLSARDPQVLAFLKEQVSKDTDWRVQEILAKAFDNYCLDTGYERALPDIDEWLADSEPNVRRAVTEGLRIWTDRDYFKENPGEAIRRLAPLHADESEYVRKSVGNALRDISRTHPDLISTELEGWELSDRRAAQTYKLASRFLAAGDGRTNPAKGRNYG